MLEGKVADIADEIVDEGIDCRKACGKIRGLLRVALARGTKSEYRQGCLAVLALVDEIDPTGKGFQVVRETFAPGNPEEARQSIQGRTGKTLP